jgi:hypothetical protein
MSWLEAALIGGVTGARGAGQRYLPQRHWLGRAESFYHKRLLVLVGEPGRRCGCQQVKRGHYSEGGKWALHVPLSRDLNGCARIWLICG